jgi:hypothetical protein
MTAGFRRWTRRSQSHHISHRLAAVWRDQSANLGSIEVDLLDQGRFREMVAVALLLTVRACVLTNLLNNSFPFFGRKEISRDYGGEPNKGRTQQSLHNISYQTLSIRIKFYLEGVCCGPFASSSASLIANGEPGFSLTYSLYVAMAVLVSPSCSAHRAFPSPALA